MGSGIMVNIPTSHKMFLSLELEIAIVESLRNDFDQLSSSLMSRHWYMTVFRPLKEEGPVHQLNSIVQDTWSYCCW